MTRPWSPVHTPLRRDGVRRLAAAGASVALACGLVACTAGPDDTAAPMTVPHTPGVNGTPAPAGPTTPVPAPGGEGDATQTVTPMPAPEPMAEEIGASAAVAQGIEVAITDVAAITAASTGPGEVAGPAVAVTIDVTNNTAEPFDLALVQVNLADSEGLPGSGMIGAPADWFTGSVEPGASAQGVYVFTVPEGHRSPVHVEVSVDPTLPTVVFTGDVG